MVDVAIVGAGPAGLATAIACAERGLETLVLERAPDLPDKACGEGLMPRAVRALDSLGVTRLIDRERSSPIDGIRFLQEDGRSVEACFPAARGLTVRRTALVEALAHRARAAGATLRFGGTVRGLAVDADGATLRLDDRTLAAKVVVAADGLHSRIRSLAGLEVAGREQARYGLRRHFTCAPWSSYVEVHWADGREAYVTPVGPNRVGVAFLFSPGDEPARHDRLLARFPELARRLEGAPFDSAPRGAGPRAQRVTHTVADRRVLGGDAAGYVDAITGEGMTLAFEAALTLGELLPAAIRAGATAATLEPYRKRHLIAFRQYARYTRLLLLLSANPRLRRHLIDAAIRRRTIFETGLGYFTGELPLSRALRGLARPVFLPVAW